MGRSYLSIKLAVVFGICIAALVALADRGALLPAREQVRHAAPASAEPAPPQAHAVSVAEVICLGRVCALLPQQPLNPRSAT